MSEMLILICKWIYATCTQRALGTELSEVPNNFKHVGKAWTVGCKLPSLNTPLNQQPL